MNLYQIDKLVSNGHEMGELISNEALELSSFSGADLSLTRNESTCPNEKFL